MRLGFLLVPFVALLAACTVETTTGGEPTPPPFEKTDTIPEEETDRPPPPPKQTVAAPLPYEGPHVEVVYVHMKDKEAGRWICTGTLISSTRVVTAAHCLDPKMFISWEVIAPLAQGKPSAFAYTPEIFGGSYEDVANPDIGILKLKKAIDLPVYAELTDVVAKVEAGEKVLGASVVRTEPKIDAPLVEEKPGAVTSTVGFGYDHGFGVPMFSKGGDSGAGLFLVEDGKLTHKLIGVARQPEPERNIDHFTRIDKPFLDWYAAR